MRKDESSTRIRNILARNVRRLRKDEGFSQQQLADAICMNRTYLSDLENGKGNVSVDILVKIADGLDVPITKLFEGMDDKPPRKL